jgi:hypothetical protein
VATRGIARTCNELRGVAYGVAYCKTHGSLMLYGWSANAYETL